MSAPTTVEEVFDQMYAELKESKILGLEELDTFAKKQITLAQGKCAFMKDKTASDFSYIASKLMLAKQKKALSPLPTAEEFWEAAHTYNPLTSLGSRNETPLVKILGHARRMDAIPLGNLYGNTAAVLVPSASSLPLSHISEKNFTSFHFADTDSGAIAYPDGHPSENYDQGGSHFDIIVKPNEDNKLRRFCSLGWVAIDIGMDQWEKTGHVLVMDMDLDRGHQPWFVLASSWPSDNGEDPNGDFELHAERSAVRGQEGVLGVLPGDSTRTPIAKLVHMGDAPKDSTKPFFKQLGPDFNFTLQRSGGDRATIRTKRHPDVAHIMAWYWDDTAQEEVCYAANGQEYMRYHRGNGTYRYPDLAKIPMIGKQGLFGQISSPAMAAGPIPLSARMGGLSMGRFVPRKHYETSSSGF